MDRVFRCRHTLAFPVTTFWNERSWNGNALATQITSDSRTAANDPRIRRAVGDQGLEIRVTGGGLGDSPAVRVHFALIADQRFANEQHLNRQECLLLVAI